jgi:hypothetical protein
VVDVRIGHALPDTIEEILRIPIDLEFDQIVSEQSAQQRFVRSARQQPQDVRRRKRNVPKLMNE